MRTCECGAKVHEDSVKCLQCGKMMPVTWERELGAIVVVGFFLALILRILGVV